jgi:hypothetical protein
MAHCPLCGEALPAGSRTCALCGATKLRPEAAPAAAWPAPDSSAFEGEVLPPGTRLCPGCGKIYGPDYADGFCACGLELFAAHQLPAATVEHAGVLQPEGKPESGELPPAGTACLILYDEGKRPLRYFPLDKEAIVIGRLDAVAGHFPDIDVSQWLEAALARKVSRKHALVLRPRSSGDYFLRPLAGNTGTQWGVDLVEPLKDYPLEPGCRIILGGAVRFKFDVT